MRTKIMIILTTLILILFNYGIYQKEMIKKEGETVFLKLAPVDPRSIMQGDYMRLNYAINRFIRKNLGQRDIVIQTDDNNIGQFVRFHQKEALATNEKLIHYNGRTIAPSSFFFQEGHRQYYQDAQYGVFKFSPSGDYLLIGLANQDQTIITVN